MQKEVKNIVILGGGTAGWMAASALSRALGHSDHRITLVESEQIGTVGVGEATIPMIALFNRFLGIDESEFVRETKATFKLGIEFVNWRNLGQRYFHPFGLIGVDMDGISFTHYWLRWVKQGGGVDFSRFNAETEAAKVNKFARVGAESGPKVMPDINYAFQFDAALYANYLRKYAERRGVLRVEGTVNSVRQNSDNGFIEALLLDSGMEIEGDFFIDCSGFKGYLIEETLKTGYLDWSHWLPVNRAAAVPCEKFGELLPYTRATAQESGWQWRIPLQHRTGNGYVYCDAFVSETDAAETLVQRLDGNALATPKTLRFVTGMRKKCWNKNCLAIGLASGFLEPLESTSIHLVQFALSKLLAMFPRHGFDSYIIDRYNQEMEFEYDNIKDFLIAHYKVTEREDTEFWRYVKNMSIPDSLAEKLALFESRGEIMVRQYELFKETSWFAVLLGQGMFPKSYHPVADAVSEDELQLRLTKVRSGVQNRVNQLPKHADYLTSMGITL